VTRMIRRICPGKAPWRRILVLVCIMILSFGACGACGAGSSGKANSRVRSEARKEDSKALRRGPVRPVKWAIGKARRRSIRLLAFVPYCTGTAPKPRIEKIMRRGQRERVVLTMLVRFPADRSGGCLGVERGLFSPWIYLPSSLSRTQLYDGSTSPPERRLPS
jgi:hypothetical protein